VTLELRAGEIVGLAGVAGSGQNTLLDVLAGLQRPDAGELAVAGGSGTSAADLRARGVAWIPENRGEALVAGWSVGDNLRLYDIAVGARRESIDAAALLRAYDVRPGDPEGVAGSLSGGNQQKLLVARELDRVHGEGAAPRVVLAYGPAQGLDLRASQAIRERLVSAAEAGSAVLVASHDLDELVAVADRIVVMFGGRIVDDIPVAEATTERLGAAMAGLERTTA